MIALIATLWTASCVFNPRQQADPPTCGGPGIGIDSATAEANTLPRLVTDLEHDTFYAALPEGWQMKDKHKSGFDVSRGTVGKGRRDAPSVSIRVDSAGGRTPADVINEMTHGSHATAGDIVKIVDDYYRTCTYTKDGQNHLLLVGRRNDFLIKFDIINSDADDPEVRSIVHSVEMK